MRFLLFFLAAARLVSASPLTFDFSGLIDNDPYGVFGDATFTGQYTFDSNMTQVLNTVNSGGYAGSGDGYSLSLAFTGTVGGALDGVTFTADTLNITVNNDFPGPLDEYLVTGTSSTDPNLFIEITLDDFTGTAFSGTQLPLSAPSVAGFRAARFAMFAGDVDNPIEGEGALTSLTSDSTQSAAPEPSSVLLTGTGVSMLMCIAVRRFKGSN